MRCERSCRSTLVGHRTRMDHGVTCFRTGAIVWASERDRVVQKVDELAKFGFEPHQRQPIFQTGVYWFARLAAPRGKDARSIPVSSP